MSLKTEEYRRGHRRHVACLVIRVDAEQKPRGIPFRIHVAGI